MNKNIRLKKLNFNTQNLLKIAEMSFLFSKNSLDSKKLLDNSLKWDVFEPTKFMYLYQTLNMLYECSWKDFITTGEQIYGWEPVPNKNFGKYYNDSDKANYKIKMFDSFVIRTSRNTLKDKFLDKLFVDENSKMISTYISSMEKIALPKNLDEYRTNEIKSLISTIKNISNKNNWNSPNSIHYTLSILKYLTIVRNNLFHGSKEIVSLLSKSQIERFEFYNKLLEIYIELFFLLMEENYKYKRINLRELINTLSD